MTIQPREIAKLKTDLGKNEGGASPREIAAFKIKLQSASLDAIRTHLTEQTISSRWKRNLAIAEVARRNDESLADDAEAPTRRRRTPTPLWGRWLAGALIGISSLIVLYAAFEWWRI